MKFIKENAPKGLKIPAAALRISGFPRGERVEIHALDNSIVLLKGHMTAPELVGVIQQLSDLSTELFEHLAEVCGPCEDCAGNEECPADPSRTATMIPEELRKEANIPTDAKLCAWMGDTPGTITVGQAEYRYDLTDVPPWILEILTSRGVCLGALEELLMEEDDIYGG